MRSRWRSPSVAFCSTVVAWGAVMVPAVAWSQTTETVTTASPVAPPVVSTPAPATPDYIGQHWHAGLSASVQIPLTTQTDCTAAVMAMTGCVPGTSSSSLGVGFWVDAPIVVQWLRVEVGGDLYPGAPSLLVYGLAKFVLRPTARVQPYIGVGPVAAIDFSQGGYNSYGGLAALGATVWLSDRFGITARGAYTLVSDSAGTVTYLTFDFGVSLGL